MLALILERRRNYGKRTFGQKNRFCLISGIREL